MAENHIQIFEMYVKVENKNYTHYHVVYVIFTFNFQ